MFLKKSSVDDFVSELEQNLQTIQSAPLEEKKAKTQKALECLLKAADLLDDVGLLKYAGKVTEVLESFAWSVPKSDCSGLTSEKMESNLKEKGWVFDANDGVASAPKKETESKPKEEKTDPKAESKSEEPTEDAKDENEAKDGEILDVADPDEGDTVTMDDEGDLEVEKK